MPGVGTTHFVLDLTTLFAVTVFISASGGLLLVLSWVQHRRTPALAFWGIGYLVASAGAAMLASHGPVPNDWKVCGANALVCLAYGILWGGARTFEGRRIHIPLIAAGAAIWIVASHAEMFAQSLSARISLVAVILATYTLLAARELWYARDLELISRWPTLVLITVHSAFLYARVAFADDFIMSALSGQPRGVAISIMAFEALFIAVCVPFLRIAMSKERAELEQRRAACTDSLTGVANRRAFFDSAGPLLACSAAERRSAALLLFDLDRFKEVNDTAGHQAGDQVLKSFSDLVAVSMQPGDLFGRLGGEEFACVLGNASMAEALRTAERLRREFAMMEFPGLTAAPTVSVGVAMANDTGRDLQALLATADRALYRAKAEGRNRVAPAPLMLIDTGGEGAAQASQADRPRALAAPVAG